MGKKGQALLSRLNKDALVISKRRRVLLTHSAVVDKENIRMATREAQKVRTAQKRAEKLNKKRQEGFAKDT